MRDVSAALRRASASAHAAGERGEYRHVQAGNRDEVRDAGFAEHAPLRFRNRALIADRKRDQHALVRRRRQCARDALADALARALHVIVRATGEGADADVGRIVAHIAGGAQVVLEQPRLEIEPVRVDVAVRPLETHRQRPALSGVNDRRMRGVSLARCARRIPRERDATRDDGARRDDAARSRRRSAIRYP